MTRPLAVLSVLALVVLAGCGSLGGVGTTRHPFDVDDPTRTTPPNGPSDVDPPPVISFNPADDTATGAFVLVDAHYATLTGRAYTVDYTTTARYGDGTVLYSDAATRTIAPNRSTFVQERSSRNRNDSIERDLYANGTHVWERTTHDNGNATVRVLRNPNGDPVSPRDAVSRIAPSELTSGLLAMNVTDVTKLDTVPSSANEPVFEVTSNRTATPDPFGDRTLNASMTLIVSEDGRIIEYVLERTYVLDDRRVHELTRIQFQNVGRATVTPPAWISGNRTANASDPDKERPANALVSTPSDHRTRSSPTPNDQRTRSSRPVTVRAPGSTLASRPCSRP